VALCHEWLHARHGSEKTFEAMAAALPSAALHALTRNPSAGLDFAGRPVSTTFLDRPRLRAADRMLQLPLMPLAWRYASRARYDVVVTSSHACAKGFRPARSALHLCYCYTPMRYAWLASVDQRRPPRPGRPLRERANLAASRAGGRALRAWDRRSAAWVDSFAAISTAVADRVSRCYGRDAVVIHPPVATSAFTPGDPSAREGYALAVSRMVPYKRLDLAIRAAHQLRHPLVVAGAGPGEARLRALAAELAAEVRFVVDPTDADLIGLYRGAGVLVFPAEEDFGIVPVEAQACGTPVVAFGRGGARDTVVHGTTGVLVEEQTVSSVAAGIEAVLAGGFDAGACRRNAERFSAEAFRHRFLDWVLATAAAAGIHVDDPRVPQPA
jgi:glycosyltransferase involved in cell wall biosynthesis